MQHIKHYSLGLLVVLALLLGALISAQPALAANGELKGQGTEGDPYLIYDADDLIEFAEKVNSYNPWEIDSEAEERDAWAELRNDINLEGKEWTRIGSSNSNYYLEYIGTFDGNNHIIRGFSINTSSTSTEYFGLFGAVGEGGTVRNLTVEGSIFIDSEDGVYAGGVVGYNTGNVSNCTSEVAITVEAEYAYIGGIIGSNAGNVSNCTNKTAITATADTAYIGGMVGLNFGIVENCSNSGAVEGTGQAVYAYVGGIVGANSHTQSVMGSVSGCTNTGTVTASGNNATAGGVVGLNVSTVSSCYNTGAVTSTTTAGGVAGANSAESYSGTVTSCYNIGTVIGTTTAGGVVGANSSGTTPGTVNGCYYREDTAKLAIGDGSGTVENDASKTFNQFHSGEVAWLLQKAVEQDGSTTTQVWGQGFGENDYPELRAFDAGAQKVYQVAFMNGEQLFDAAYTNSGGTVSAPTTPEREGYTFDGWYSDESLTDDWNFEADTVSKDMNLYAKWTARIYPVTLITNGGTINSGNITEYTYGVGAKLPTDVTRTGYTFGGWYENGNFSGEPVTEISTTDTDDKTYYAKWTPIPYTVTFDSNGGSTVESKTVHYGDTVTKPADPTRDGYTFTGWYSNAELTTSWDFNTPITADTTLYAKWTEIPTYTVTVSANPAEGGTVTSSVESAPSGTKVTVTATPEDGYHFVRWTENDTTVSTAASYTFNLEANRTLVAVFEQDQTPTPDPDPDPTPTPDPDPSGPSTGESDGWESIADEITAADDGDSITIDMNGETEVPADIFEDVAGKDVDLVFDMGDGLSWSVNGQDIPVDADLSDLDLGVDLGTDGIPVDVINAITGEKDSVQITLAYDGDFGFTLTLTAPLGEDNAGYWANLYHYDEDTEAMNFEAAAEIGADGSVSLPLSHASQYAIVIDDHSHASTDVSEIFTDVPANHWARAAIQYVYDNGLMTGVSDTAFAPEATTTRAMIVSMLARMEGVTSAADAGFADVNASDWYATAVNWAAANGIVNGISDDTFAPNDPITREQLAAMLMNYAQWKGQDTSARADLSGYTDTPSTWASEAVQWAVAEGLLAGVTDDQLQPQGNATRAQVAAILQRFLEA